VPGKHGGGYITLIFRGVARIMEKYRHKLFRRRVWGRLSPQWIQGRALVRGPGRSYTAERVTFLIILEVLLAT
jgi:hypothetical protein